MILARAILCALTAAAPAGSPKPAPQPAASKPPLPFTWTTPEGWRAETIPFPLDFAKDLPLTGLEELRFAPGMFKPDQPGYWSYAFVWWLDGTPSLSAEDLQRHLKAYFEGLTVAVGAEKKLAVDPKRFAAALVSKQAPDKKAGHEVHAFEGTADLYDAFATGKPIHLNLDVWVWDCSHTGKRVAVVLASPHELNDAMWIQLRARRGEMSCHPKA